jgi:short-chain Z-isoprenyl diphosphate synthase
VAVIRKAEEATAGYYAMTLTIAVSYGGREEIADSGRDLIRAKVRDGLGVDELAEHITPASIDQYLYTVGLPDPDLIIRTSGEQRDGLLCVKRSREFTLDAHWPSSAKSTSLARSARFNRGRDAQRGARKAPDASKECQG